MSAQRVTFAGAGGVRLAADLAGPVDGARVILLHGGGQTRHSWSGASHRLAEQGYRVANLDLRGHGDSDWSPDGDYELGALAGDVLAVVRASGRPAALVGASLGGVSAFYAAATAERGEIAALVMVDIALRSSREGTDRIGGFMAAHAGGFASLDEAAAAVAAFNPNARRRPGRSGLLKNLRRRQDGRYHWHWDPRILVHGRPGALEARHDRLVEVSSRVTIPTLLVRGQLSDVVSPDNVREMRRLVPQTAVVEIAGTGHMLVGDRNDAFVSCVADFLGAHHPPNRGDR